MKKVVLLLVAISLLVTPVVAFADLKTAEKDVFEDFKKAIPADRIKTVDELFEKWLEIKSGKSSAVILDVRTEFEFNDGHIFGSSNLDSGMVYTMPERFTDPNTEIWVFCRTAHRSTYFVGMLYKYGYKNVNLVKDGISGWAQKGYPLFNTYLGEVKVTKYEKKLKEEYLYRDNK